MKVLQNSPTIFETDLFEPIRTKILEKYAVFHREDAQSSLRIILDHLRGSIFLIADDVYPSNLERGYVLRRILRRLVLKLKQNSIKLKETPLLINAVVEKFGEVYPELKNIEKIEKIFFAETEKFEKTFELGLKKFDKIVQDKDSPEILGEKFFKLHSTYGLPIEISAEIAKERALETNEFTLNVFKKLFEKHQRISKHHIADKHG
jgi:alanyl-tRNA synthetase